MNNQTDSRFSFLKIYAMGFAGFGLLIQFAAITTNEYDGEPVSRPEKVITVLIGLVLIGIGFVLHAVSRILERLDDIDESSFRNDTAEKTTRTAQPTSLFSFEDGTPWSPEEHRRRHEEEM